MKGKYSMENDEGAMQIPPDLVTNKAIQYANNRLSRAKFLKMTTASVLSVTGLLAASQPIRASPIARQLRGGRNTFIGQGQRVQKISCTNNAGFVMDFWLEWIDINSGELHWTNGNSGNYPIDQERTLNMDNLGEAGPPAGSLVRPHVQAVLGTDKPGNTFVVYEPGCGNVATYNVAGTTFNYSVSLNT